MVCMTAGYDARAHPPAHGPEPMGTPSRESRQETPMSTMNADSGLAFNRRVSTRTGPSYRTTGLSARAVVALASLIAGAGR